MYSKIFRYIWVCMCVGCPESSFPNTILYNFYCWMPNNLSLDWLWQLKCVYLCILCLWRGATTTTHCWLICKKITDRHHLYLSVFTPHEHTCFWASEFDGKYQQTQWIWSKLAGWVETDKATLTSGYRVGRQSSPGDRHSPWLSWPSRRLGWACCRLRSSPSRQTTCQNMGEIECFERPSLDS